MTGVTPGASSGRKVGVRRRIHGLHVIEHPRDGDQHKQAPVVVLVHGSLDRSSSFSRVVRRLSELHVVTYDRRGYHHSRPAGGLMDEPRSAPGSRTDGAFDTHVRDLLEVIGDRPAVVVGHSFGGDIALGAAARAPEKVGAVGAYEPPLPWVEWWPRRQREIEQDPTERAESFFRRVVGDEAWERLTESAREQRRADGPALVAELGSLRREAPPFDFGELSMPVVLGRGGASIPHHRKAVEELGALIARAEIFEVAGASHGAHLSHPDAFARFVRRVVERSEAS